MSLATSHFSQMQLSADFNPIHQIKLCYGRWSADQPQLVPSTRLGLKSTVTCLLTWLSSMSRDRSVVYSCSWSSQAQPIWGPNTVGYLTVSYSWFPKPGGPGVPGPRIYIPQEQGGLVALPVTGFPFRHLLLLAGLKVLSFHFPGGRRGSDEELREFRCPARGTN
jgi:hypothetical protein